MGGIENLAPKSLLFEGIASSILGKLYTENLLPKSGLKIPIHQLTVEAFTAHFYLDNLNFSLLRKQNVRVSLEMRHYRTFYCWRSLCYLFVSENDYTSRHHCVSQECSDGHEVHQDIKIEDSGHKTKCYTREKGRIDWGFELGVNS